MPATSDYSGKYHILAIQEEWDHLFSRLREDAETNPQEVHDKLLFRDGPNQWTTLMLCLASAPVKLIALILKCCPECSSVVDRSESTPLHFVSSWRSCENDNDDTLITILHMLLRISPQSLNQLNNFQQTPLHCIFDCEYDRGEGIVNVLLGGALDKSLENHRRNKFGTWQSDDLQNLQIEIFSALSTMDSNRNLPLHLAAMKGSSEDILRALVLLYPDATRDPNNDGDLPIHLLHYGAKEAITSDKVKSVGESNTHSKSWRNKLFNKVTCGQVEALLEPIFSDHPNVSAWKEEFGVKPQDVATILGTAAVGVTEQGFMTAITESDEENAKSSTSNNSFNPSDDKNASEVFGRRTSSIDADISASASKTNSNDMSYENVSKDGSKINAKEYNQLGTISDSEIRKACSLKGSKDKFLPIHIASEHGVSMYILAVLCRMYPEGVGTPVSVNNTLIYPLELFETGRAGMNAELMARMQKRHVDNPNNNTLTNVTLASITGSNIQKLAEELEGFHERSDLLFAYYPEAIPSWFEKDKNGLYNSSKRSRWKKDELFRRDAVRLSRLESIIRREALDHSTSSLSTTATLIWSWMCSFEKATGMLESETYLPNIGRIIYKLPDFALDKLSYLKSDDQSDNPLRLVNGKTLHEEAKQREPTTTLDDLFKASKGRNWQRTLFSFLSDRDGLCFSETCQNARESGLRFLPEIKLNETGQSWTFPSYDELGSTKGTYWQSIDSMLVAPNCTHTVYITYYLEVSEFQRSRSIHHTFNGGLVVASEPSDKNTEAKIMALSEYEYSKSLLVPRRLKEETAEQKPVLESTMATISGCEVRLSFKYTPGRAYSLYVYGPPSGGRVSVSHARVRQLMYGLDENNLTPLHLFLSSKVVKPTPTITTQVHMLMDTFFSSKSLFGILPLHYSLKYGVSVEVLQALVDENPSSVLETDHEGRTPLHAVFLLARDEPPSVDIIKTLLQTPGENATRKKDSASRLPLHIAAERGATDIILSLLVESFVDGCYSQNKDGDLPLHLLVRSGRATTSSIELLLRPIMNNVTMCKMPGSEGIQLPLHIAAEYNCCFKVLESLLQTFPDSACIPMCKTKDQELYALDIFEMRKIKSTYDDSMSVTSNCDFKEAAKQQIDQADANLRSDLIFVYNPQIIPAEEVNLSDTYRRDPQRLRRLRNLIRREALECSERKAFDEDAKMSDMAALGWCFFCTFKNRNDRNDNYKEAVLEILNDIPTSAVQILADVKHQLSSVKPPPSIIDCATSFCKNAILSRLLLFGRYVIDEDTLPIHESDSTLVVGARDNSTKEKYKKVLAFFDGEYDIDVDDLNSIISGSVFDPADEPRDIFLSFAIDIGLDEDLALMECNKIFTDALKGTLATSNSQLLDHKDEGKPIQRTRLELFRRFCQAYRVDHDGSRQVVIKFMRNRIHFLKEKEARLKLQGFCGVLPVIDDFDLDRLTETDKQKFSQKSIASSSSVSDTNVSMDIDVGESENKDLQYYQHVMERSSSTIQCSTFRYALVIPRGDYTLDRTVMHEHKDISKVRRYMHQIALALKALHENLIVHGDLRLSNVVRLGDRISFIDLRSASQLENDKLGRSSSSFGSAIVPPEMIARIDLVEDDILMLKYEEYWKDLSTDAYDFASLNMDDIALISDVLRKSENFHQKAATSNFGVLRQRLVSPIQLTEQLPQDENYDWKQLFSSINLPNSLQGCSSLEEFRDTFEKLQNRARTWKKIRPRVTSDGHFAYMLKTYDHERYENFDSNSAGDLYVNNMLPYELLPASEKSDIWAFGMILFTLLTSSSLLNSTYDCMLRNVDAYEQLYEWNSEKAVAFISAAVDDDLARDLLLNILVPFEYRLPNMDAVLEHPFFDSISGRKKGAVPNVVLTSSGKLKEFDEFPTCSILPLEQPCKIVFDRIDIIPFPTSFILLPYRMNVNVTNGKLEVPRNLQSLIMAETIGKHLLAINTLTAKLSFWLKMKRNLSNTNGKQFKTLLIEFIKRAHTESSETIAKEILSAVGCGPEYTAICIEMLDKSSDVSHAREFIKDPMSAASKLIKERTRALFRCYTDMQQFYLIDEFTGLPVIREGENCYPIEIVPHIDAFSQVFLPFMELTLMSVTAIHGLEGLMLLLGLPPSHKIPDSWKKESVGLIHKKTASNTSSIVEFATMQKVLRSDERFISMAMQQSNILSEEKMEAKVNKLPKEMSTILSGGSVGFVDDEDSNDLLRHLEAFYNAYDPEESFAGLHRICDPKMTTSIGIWTQYEISEELRNQIEMEQVEARRRLLEKEIEEKQKMQSELETLNQRIQYLKQIKRKTSDDEDVIPKDNGAPSAESMPIKTNATIPQSKKSGIQTSEQIQYYKDDITISTRGLPEMGPIRPVHQEGGMNKRQLKASIVPRSVTVDIEEMKLNNNSIMKKSDNSSHPRNSYSGLC